MGKRLLGNARLGASLRYDPSHPAVTAALRNYIVENHVLRPLEDQSLRWTVEVVVNGNEKFIKLTNRRPISVSSLRRTPPSIALIAQDVDGESNTAIVTVNITYPSRPPMYDLPSYFWGIGPSVQNGDIIGVVGASDPDGNPLIFSMDPNLANFLTFDPLIGGKRANVRITDAQGLLTFLQNVENLNKSDDPDVVTHPGSYFGRIFVSDSTFAQDSAEIVVSLVGAEDIFDQIDKYIEKWGENSQNRGMVAKENAYAAIDSHAGELLNRIAVGNMNVQSQANRGWAFSTLSPNPMASTLMSLVFVEYSIISTMTAAQLGGEVEALRTSFRQSSQTIFAAEQIEIDVVETREQTRWSARKAEIRRMPPTEQVRAASEYLTELQLRLPMPSVIVPSSEDLWNGLKAILNAKG